MAAGEQEGGKHQVGPRRGVGLPALDIIWEESCSSQALSLPCLDTVPARVLGLVELVESLLLSRVFHFLFLMDALMTIYVPRFHWDAEGTAALRNH